MRQLPGLIMLAGALLMVSGPAYSGDVKAGRALARIWCSACHVVEADQEQATDVGPPFGQIANDPSKSTLGLATWLADPHPPMPKLSLTQDQIRDLVEYIKTMKTE